MKLIPKYQNAGLVTRQDNTYVAKPTIPPKLIKRTYTPTQSYVSQDNRSGWQREQGSKKADEEYKKYVEDKKIQQGLENLNGFLNFVDAATIATGVGKGLRWGGKKVANQLVKREINSYGKVSSGVPSNYKGNEFDLVKERLKNGGFDRLEKHGDISNYTPEMRTSILGSKPRLGTYKTMGDKLGYGIYRKDYAVNIEELQKHYTPQQATNVGAHELTHFIYRPSKEQEAELSYNVRQYFPDVELKDYFRRNRATEQSARGTQLKNYFGFNRGEQNITPEMWEYAKKNYVKDTGMDNQMTEWFNSIDERDVSNFLKWLNNNSPMLTTPIIGGHIYGDK